MNTVYGRIPTDTIQKQKKYLYGSLIDLLYKKEENYLLLDQRIQTLINQINGSLALFNNDPRVLSMVACLEDARMHSDQFRKNVLDAANLVDQLGGDSDV